MIHTGFFARGGGGDFVKSQNFFLIYIIIWSSHDLETVKQISDENLTIWRLLGFYIPNAARALLGTLKTVVHDGCTVPN